MINNINNKPTVVLWSDPTGLAINLVERLLMNFCRINIFTDKEKNWQNKLDHLPNKNAITISNKNEINNIENTFGIKLHHQYFKNSSSLLSNKFNENHVFLEDEFLND